MKYRAIIFSLLISVLCMNLSCKKFLNVSPVGAMSGNNFWKTKQDVEQYANGIYTLLRSYTCGNGNTLLAMADYRCGSWVPNVTNGNEFVALLRGNKMNNLVASSNYAWWDDWGFGNMDQWMQLYRVVSGANNLIANVPGTDIADLTDADRRLYHAEAVFIRSLSYFIMVRHWGDIPYIADINDVGKNPRTNQVELFQKCINDLQGVLGDLPWTYADASKKGSRAMKGGALVLMMEMYMWMAGFDDANAMAYYQKVADLSHTLIEEGGNYYKLLPYDNYQVIFNGHSDESLFEISQSSKPGELFSFYATVGALTLMTPYKPSVSVTPLYYDQYYLHQLYDVDYNGSNADARASQWFENMFSTDGTFIFKKFANFNGGVSGNPTDAKIMFRYVDAFLLRAEALEKLGDYPGALEAINVVRKRAGATEFEGGKTVTNMAAGITLEDAIWWERERELMGESSFFYDLVRTKKIMSSLYTMNTINYEDFMSGAWTYPIDAAISTVNPNVSSNPYWN
ncbi:RagB/SusD family nutrient uptake outer membrane protein [Niabella aurantiaca]|uniref:RagB/SusD family nutrient uptake outer membrane protein n=1 Tax=Niabella aurantiaca TaxID=379900 RepID=UPI0009FF5FC0|nr:RagB/SusD family nutrient uptake outer membrane protein [Niabella aurantiaca]